MAYYHTALVTYIDILGFSDLIDESRNEKNQHPDRVDKILRLLTELKRANGFTSRYKDDDQQNPIQIFFADNFSDCLVRSTRIDADDEIVKAISAELLILSSMQTHVTVNEHMIIRGGMALGELYRDPDSNFLFGPAFVDAYRLEKKAVVPRIVIQEKIINVMRKAGGSFLSDYVMEDQDGICFEDYLHGAYVDLGLWPIENVSSNDDMMEAHRNAVVSKIKELQGKSVDIRLKAQWLANYHNRVINRMLKDWPDYSERIGNLKIDTTELLS